MRDAGPGGTVRAKGLVNSREQVESLATEGVPIGPGSPYVAATLGEAARALRAGGAEVLGAVVLAAVRPPAVPLTADSGPARPGEYPV